jgi:hypothetical protein
VIGQITQGELKRLNQPATVNRYLATLRNFSCGEISMPLTLRRKAWMAPKFTASALSIPFAPQTQRAIVGSMSKL